ncbi:MAG: PaaI family thioesterase [Anaerolineales bacterium]|nr:PaaI family thioesterase [Anaerolineales bacterium]
MEALPEHGKCFVCGSQNPHSMGIRWYVNAAGEIHTKVTLTEAQQGPPGHAHGGATAAILDEAMGAAVWSAGHRVLSVNLNIDYKAPVPLDKEVEITARISGKGERSVHTTAELCLANGKVAVNGRGIYVEAPQFFNENTENPFWRAEHD